ncbi:hypothetical protein [Pseudomonas kribbensis]|uniref:Uncharacterized protein n=1 Tax=Pseudomonas kribbensis TaxID=1628086 RepID=A0A4Y8VH81_9PSED|nr:hypothetical protein [Pseudomonas kribbensis]TFH79414.1 hypothetical protein E4J90_16465 [Pseudomonas kribbensis]
MSDFIKAFESGVKAANDAEANISEIYGVFSEIGVQLETFSGGKLTLIRGTKDLLLDDSKHDPLSSIVGNTLKALSKRIKKDCLCIKLNGENTLHDISFYEISKTGYPISLSFSGKSITCHDKLGLEEALRELFSHPDTGKIINKLTAQANKISSEDDNAQPQEES